MIDPDAQGVDMTDPAWRRLGSFEGDYDPDRTDYLPGDIVRIGFLMQRDLNGTWTLIAREAPDLDGEE